MIFLGPLACIVDSLPKMGSRQKSPSVFNEALHVVTTDAGVMLKYQWYQTCHLLRVILRPSRSGWQLLFERSCKTEETAMYLGHWQSDWLNSKLDFRPVFFKKSSYSLLFPMPSHPSEHFFGVAKHTFKLLPSAHARVLWIGHLLSLRSRYWSLVCTLVSFRVFSLDVCF